MLRATALCLSVSVTTWTVGVLAKRMDGSSYFWHGGFLTSIVHSVLSKFGYLKITALPYGTLSQLNSGLKTFSISRVWDKVSERVTLIFGSKNLISL